MSDYGVTDDGFVLKRLDVIMEEVHSELTEGFGVNTRMLRPSFLDVLVTSFCNQIAELWETAQDDYYAKYPATATGKNLDNVIQFAGISRKAAKHTVYPLHCTGVDGTEVTMDAMVGSDTNPQITLSPSDDFTITRESCNRISIKVVVEEAGEYTVTINEQDYSYTNSEGTALEILNGLKSAITTTEYTVEVDEENLLLNISDNTVNRTNSIALSDNLTTETVTTIANFDTTDYGKITLPNGTVTKFVINTTGFEEVTNLVTPNYGRLEETDAETRASYVNRSALRSTSMIESIISEILDNVEDVESASGYQNDTDTTDENGLPPHSIEIVVEGGESINIASTILSKKAAGINTYGSVETEITGTYGDKIKIRFNRPTYLYTWLKVTVHGKEDEISTKYEDLTKDAILSYTSELTSGDKLLTQKMLENIYSNVNGVSYVDILVAYSTDPTYVPESSEYFEGNVSATNRQKVLVDSDRIEVAFSADS